MQCPYCKKELQENAIKCDCGYQFVGYNEQQKQPEIYSENVQGGFPPLMSQKSSIGLLFDISFTEFVTTRVIKVLFVIGVICAAIGAIGLIIGGFIAGIGRGILFLITTPVVFLIYVLVARVWCELIVVVFRIAENTSKLVDQNKL